MALATACVLIAVAACGGPSTAKASGNTETVPDVLRVGLTAKVANLNPVTALGINFQILHLVGGNLYEMDGDNMLPVLASGPPTISDDGLTWTIPLREGLTFSDGSPLTSEDVKTTFETLRDDKRNVNLPLFTPMESIEAPSATSVVIHLSRPYPSLQTILGYPMFGIYPAAKVGQEEFFAAPVSAGPYMLQSWGGTDKVVLVRNPKYVGPEPEVGTLEFNTVTDVNSGVAQVQSGGLDLVNRIPPNMISQIQAPAVATIVPQYGVRGITMNTTNPILSDVRVRRAIAAAVNREQLSQLVWGGQVKPTGGMWSSLMDGYDPTLPTAPDIEKAKADLKGTACEAGCTLSLIYSPGSYPESTSEAPIVKDNLAQIGITLQLNSVDTPTWLSALKDLTYDLSLKPSWDFSNVPDGFITYGLTLGNFTGFTIPGLEPSATTAQSSTGEERTAALRELSDLLNEYVPWTPLTGSAQVYVARVPDTVARIGSGTLFQVVRADGHVR